MSDNDERKTALNGLPLGLLRWFICGEPLATKQFVLYAIVFIVLMTWLNLRGHLELKGEFAALNELHRCR